MAGADPDAFTFDPELERYESSVEAGGATIAVRVSPDAFEDKVRLGELLDVVGRERESFLSHVAGDLLEDKNDEWLSEGESPLSEEEFRRRLTLEAVEVGPGGAIELLFDDDGMFWGHQLTASLDSAYRIVRVNLEG